MDKITAQQVFKDQIGSRWPDFKLSQVLMNDWICFLTNFSPEDIGRAARQYILNYDAFKQPSLHKFKEILQGFCKVSERQKTKEEKWPQYFLQQDATDCDYWGYGTFAQVFCDCGDPYMQFETVQQAKLKYTSLYGGHWNVIICEDEAQRSLLIKDRANKNRPVTIVKHSKDALGYSL